MSRVFIVKCAAPASELICPAVGPWPLPPNSGPSHRVSVNRANYRQAIPGLFHAPDRWPAILVMPVGRARPGWRGTARRLARRPQAPAGGARAGPSHTWFTTHAACRLLSCRYNFAEAASSRLAEVASERPFLSCVHCTKQEQDPFGSSQLFIEPGPPT